MQDARLRPDPAKCSGPCSKCEYYLGNGACQAEAYGDYFKPRKPTDIDPPPSKETSNG